MTLSVTNFFTHYILNPRAEELEKWEQNLALISSIALGILTFGIIHATVYVLSNCCQLLPLIAIAAPVNGPAVDMPSTATYDRCERLLLLDGDEGTVACRVYGRLLSGTLPRFSDNGTVEFATRSLLRMNNLVAVRGERGASMIGPADYFGNLEEPHKYLYTIDTSFPPIILRTVITDENQEPPSNLKAFDPSLVTTVRMNWISGKTGNPQAKQLEYGVSEKDARQSLFPNPGLLEIDGECVKLNYFNPREVDLSSFKARLVENATPFQITKKPLPSKDDYRLVTYLYEPGYAHWQIENGSGLFLEEHLFSQTMTPINPSSNGFVILARKNGNLGELELIGVQIPYGYTLIIEEGCIHGDTTLEGFFMMGMTSDHTTMGTADTVFLKSFRTKQNMRVVMDKIDTSSDQSDDIALPPYVIYKGATDGERGAFREATQGASFIFNPFSHEVGEWARSLTKSLHN